MALAWVHWRHPAEYAQGYGWMRRLRDSVPLSGASHDTRAWLRLAADPARLGQVTQPFAAVARVWADGAR